MFHPDSVDLTSGGIELSLSFSLSPIEFLVEDLPLLILKTAASCDGGLEAVPVSTLIGSQWKREAEVGWRRSKLKRPPLDFRKEGRNGVEGFGRPVCIPLLNRFPPRALCFVSLNSHTQASASYPREGTRVSWTLYASRQNAFQKFTRWSLSALVVTPARREMIPVVRGSRLLGFTRCIILAREISKTAENLLYSHNSPRCCMCHWNFMRWRTGVLLTLST